MNSDKNAFAVTLRELGEQGKYEEQGKFFMETTRTSIEIVEAVPQRAPKWDAKGEKHGIHYVVTLKNPRGEYSFDYWGSIFQAEKVEQAREAQNRGIYSAEYFAIKDWCEEEASATVPNAIKNKKIITYDALPMAWLKNAVDTVKILVKPKAYDLCVALRPMAEDSFEDFCFNTGYSTDSISAEKIYHACIEQDRKTRKLYTHDELEAMSEIA